MDFSSANWTNVASLAIAFIALLASFGSFAVSFRAFRLSQRQDDRKKPALVPSFLNGYVWPAPGFTDTELGVLMEPEVCHGATEVYEGVQA